MSTSGQLQSSGGVGASGSIRKRARRACEPCRRRKRKCDGARPCRSCQEYEYVCAYEDERQLENPVSEPEASAPQPIVIATAMNVGITNAEIDKIYEPTKKRFYDAESAISFPRALARSLKSGVPPRIHSFAYNVGVATERFLAAPVERLSSLMSLRQARDYSARYFETVNNLFAIIDPVQFEEQLPRLWSPESASLLEVEVLACFVILLGSLFSWPSRFEAHQSLVEYSQILLDRSSFNDAPSLLQYEHLQAWILRTLFVRCTTRPNITWMSTSITMHLAESLGLHREFDTLEKLDLNVPILSSSQANVRRRLFWTAWTINRMISLETGRSATFISSINCLQPHDVAGTSTLALIRSCQEIYPDGSHLASEKTESCLLSIPKMSQPETYCDLLTALVRADLACGLYRVIHKSNPHLRQSIGEHLVFVVRRGLEAVQQLTQMSQPWWLLTSMPFQFICVAVAVGKSYILDVVPDAMQVLDNVNQHFDTKMTQEACKTARLLLNIAIETKNKELAAISKALVVAEIPEDRPSTIVEEEDWGLFFDHQVIN